MSNEMLQVPFGLLKILKTILAFPTTNILDDVAGVRCLDTLEVERAQSSAVNVRQK